MTQKHKPCSCSKCNGKEARIYKNDGRKKYCKEGWLRLHPPKPIPKVSEHRKQELKEYAKDPIPEGQVCEFPGCSKKATDKHHPAGRQGKRLNGKKKYLCRKHHDWITEHSKEAIEMGLSEFRNRKSA